MTLAWQKFIKKVDNSAEIVDDHYYLVKNNSFDAENMPKKAILADLGLVKIHGPDVDNYLQGQITCNIKQLTDNPSLLGGYCNIKGRLLADFIATRTDAETVLLSMARSAIPGFIAQLKKYAVFSKLTIDDVSEAYIPFGVTNLEPRTTSLPYQLIIADLESAETIFNNNLKAYYFTDNNYFNYLKIRAGLPTIYAETAEKFTPHDVNLQLVDSAIDFEKGCYMGQEIIARMHYRGKLKQHLYLLTIEHDELIKPGAILTNSESEPVGTVVNAAFEPGTHKQWLTAVIKIRAIESPLFLTV